MIFTKFNLLMFLIGIVDHANFVLPKLVVILKFRFVFPFYFHLFHVEDRCPRKSHFVLPKLVVFGTALTFVPLLPSCSALNSHLGPAYVDSMLYPICTT